ncbi:MAG: hypothetical protein DI603_06320 [Roseateles depolymerans]|uniref:Uncharacterized protein n=1 Tax=Roseateles depolymerans TaxID=76731 RepID=A0A2W5DV80_9BURK|nr:MAG: hypothetical protein DI603_06320 [Roseateles depolymerans]
MHVRKLLCIAILCSAGSIEAQPPAPADGAAPARVPTVALVAAIGDQLDVVRQRPSTGTNIEPFSRKSFALNSQALNYSVLRGLDRALEDEEPQTRRILLAWTAPADVKQRLAEARGSEREAIVLAALRAHLTSLPERARWDRIEAILPSYFYEATSGMGRKLSGVGFYVQPLSNGAIPVDWNINTDASAATVDQAPEQESDYKTVDPHTGKVGHSYTYLATYMYFQRITLDARTLEVLATKQQLDNIKYADPKATAIDVGDQIPLSVMTTKLLEMAEQSAYTSVRGKSYVSTTAPRPVQPAASSPP